ncbi:serine/threonine-protein kinase [Streptomyces sp. DT199]|uniref:serine/threonine-protein kinase n=1 Tax=unclassified Streptomyces TaxID=2593676 RepID=UPI00068AC642|nr:serine/threonine-protein kinase [Streptomyces sp. NRRL S-146]
MRVLAERYELIEEAGRGGMGQVWRATDRELGRVVAVKILPPELTRHEEFRVRFRREARTIASLSHRNIAVLHDVGEDVRDSGETTPFLIMEFIDGRTVADALAAGPFTVERALDVGRGIAEALAHSHGQGLVHRDIKPSNVMLTSEDGVKVLDFGISKVVAETTTRLTATGMTVGTPAYLSPEQLTGGGVDGRSDQYSTGCLLYELLTGRPPFSGDSPFAVMHQHISKEPVAPSELRPLIPAAVDEVVLRALSKDREQRFADMGEMQQALARAGSGVPALPAMPPAPPVPPPSAAGPGRTMLAEQPTQAASLPRQSTATPPPRPPVDPGEAVPDGGDQAPASSAATASGPEATGSEATGSERTDPDATSPRRGWRRLPAGNRVMALLGILVSAVVVLVHQDLDPSSDHLVPLAVVAVLGLAVFRWLPLTSTLLWWGAGAMVTAGVPAGAPSDESDYAFVSDTDFDGTLYYYGTYYKDYYQLSEDPSGHTLFERGYDGGYEPATAMVSMDYTGHEPMSVLAVPVLVLAVLCLLRTLRSGRQSALLAASGITLGGLGVGWLAAGTDDQLVWFSLGWGVTAFLAAVQELRARRRGPGPRRPRRRLRFVVAE